MNWQIIEPIKQAQRLAIAEQANRCIKWLRIQGFEVRHVMKGHQGPLIIIETNPLCEKLEGAVDAYERGPKGEYRYRMVMRLNCEVRWAVKGGAQ